MAPLDRAEAAELVDIAVVGAGVIGLAIAFRLAHDDAARRIVVIDREGVAAGASRGNAGAFAFSDIEPLASPGIVRQAPRWLFDPLGPLALRPAYLPRIAPWLWRFWRASRPQRVAASTLAQATLNRLAAEAAPRLLEAVGAASMWHEDGNLHLYESEAEWRASLPGWQRRAAHGIAFEHASGPLAREQIAQWQPGVSPAFVAATFVPRWATIADPHVLVERIAAAAARLGVRLRLGEVTSLAPLRDARAGAAANAAPDAAVPLQLAGGTVLRARRVVVAAGAWSHRLAATIGDRIPLETERGYNTTLPPGAFALRRQLTFPRHGFVVTPIAGGVRVGGAVELAGLDAPPNYARSDALLAKASRFLPALRTGGGTRWMGCRPSLPDSLPAIGSARGDARVVYAFGHGHLGLTQSAATAELVAALVAGRAPAIDLAPFDPGRFGP
ncbi:MAG: FAD-binding oxidoreductase [Proteobacteria bacterium]|nr:FAD-binding oxidoreductase [Pseudomonadota bacterium]